MTMIRIDLTEAQAEAADWLLGTPIFEAGIEADELSFDHGLDMREAQLLAVDREHVAIEDGHFVLPPNAYLIEYLNQYCDDLAELEIDNGIDQYMDEGLSHRDANLKAHAHQRAILALSDKLQKAYAEVTGVTA